MPRLARPPARVLALVAVAAVAVAAPPAVVHGAFAAAAGTVFEAAPFVLAAAAFGGRLRRVIPFVGCGCGRAAGPGALSLPATALCWATFGPAVALGRFTVALGLAAWPGRRIIRDPSGHHAGNAAGGPDPLAELEEVALAAFGVALAVWLGAFAGGSGGHAFGGERDGPVAPSFERSGAASAGGFLANTAAVAGGFIPKPAAVAGGFIANIAAFAGAFGGNTAAFVAGLAVGAVAPCVTAGVAAAAALRATLPWASAGLMMSCGLLSIEPLRRAWARVPAAGLRPSRVGALVLAGACAWLVATGGRGFVNPRLLPVVALAVPAALHLAGRGNRTAARAPVTLALGLLGALAAGSPEPVANADVTTLADAYPGEALTFVGRAWPSGGRTVVVRYLIACCRADATPAAVRTSSALRTAAGAWVAVQGRFARNAVDGALDLRVTSWREAGAPRDPFLYR